MSAPRADERPQRSAAAAVEALLRAEQHHDYGAAYAFVAHGADQPFTSASKWRRAQEGLPEITGFTVTSRSADEAVATVTHVPGLDPFVGLIPASEHQTWRARDTKGGWLLEQRPAVAPLLPPDSDAIDAARAWFEATQRCDRPAALRMQAVSTLFDSTATTSRICGRAGAVRTDGVAPLAPGPISADIVAQYSDEALVWARVVTIDAPVTIEVVLAPIGDTWKVIGIGDPV